MNRHNWWQQVPSGMQVALNQIWIPAGTPGHAGIRKAHWQQHLDARFGADGWRIGHFVRGQIVSVAEAIREYEQGYRAHLHKHPEIVEFLVTFCGNVYDDNISNVYDDSYYQLQTHLNHYQDISVRRVIAELVDDPDWPTVIDTAVEDIDLIDLKTGETHRLPRARGFQGQYLLQIREPDTPGFFLNPAAIPVHDPTLITSLPGTRDWYLEEGCGHLSIEAFWQMSKVIEVRYDRFLPLGEGRLDPLKGLA